MLAIKIVIAFLLLIGMGGVACYLIFCLGNYPVGKPRHKDILA